MYENLICIYVWVYLNEYFHTVHRQNDYNSILRGIGITNTSIEPIKYMLIWNCLLGWHQPLLKTDYGQSWVFGGSEFKTEAL